MATAFVLFALCLQTILILYCFGHLQILDYHRSESNNASPEIILGPEPLVKEEGM